MYSKFLEGLTGKVADQWVSTLLTPAFLFWSGGLIAYITHNDWATFSETILALSQPAQAGLLIASFILLVLSANLIQAFDSTTIRFLEGYWPHWMHPLQTAKTKHHQTQWQQNSWRWSELHHTYQQDPNRLTAPELSEYARLDWQIVHSPTQKNQFLPTRLGNLLRASEHRSAERYGLDAVLCWPRLWLLIPDTTRQDLQSARAALNQAARNWLWSILFLVWTPLGLWVPILCLVSAWLNYRLVLNAANVYTDLLESTFDLHRHRLYQALRFPLPQNSAQEISYGKRLTAYLWRGPNLDQAMPDLYDPPSSS